MTISSNSSTSSSSATTRRSCLMYTLAILLSPSITSTATATATTAHKPNRLRGVKHQDNSHDASNNNNNGINNKPRSTRQLYGRQFPSGFDALTSSRANIPLEHVPEEKPSSSSSSRVGKPVYFEKQSENPNTNSNPNLRIIGGTNSLEQRNFCMHLRWDIFNEEYLFAGCGGALISNCHVLTAAHCSSDGRVGLPDGLYCNAYNPFEGNYGQDFHFSPLGGTFIHPDFNNANNQNDIAILELETCIDDISQYPVMNVADADFMERLNNLGGNGEDDLVVSGFGRLEEDLSAQVEHLQQVQVPYIPKESCAIYYPGRIYEDMLCAGDGSAGGIDACQGDSGGALFHQGQTAQGSGLDTNQTAVGVVSWGSGCAQPGRPGVYASVAFHHDWIQNIVCTHDRTDQSIDLCAPLQEAPVDDVRTTCAALHQACDATPCCSSSHICKSRSVGAAPTCAVAPSSSRQPLSNGRGGAGGASKGSP